MESVPKMNWFDISDLAPISCDFGVFGFDIQITHKFTNKYSITIKIAIASGKTCVSEPL